MYGDSNVKVGTSEALSSYVGPRGEVNFTSDTKKLFVHDGQTPGGIEVGLTADAIRSVAADDESNTTLGDVLSAAVIQSIIDQEAITDAVVAAEGISKVARQSIGETEIKDGNITTDKFAANTITGDKVAANTLTSFNILGRTIQAGDIATGSLTANEIGANQLTSASGIFGDVSVDVLAAGTITSSNIFLGSSQFHLDGSNNRIEIDDDNGITRVRLGNLGAGATNWGLELFKDNGDTIVDLAGLGSDVVNSVNIANGAISAAAGHINDLSADDINTGTMTAGAIDAASVNVYNLDADKINAGTLSADFIDGGDLRLSTGMTVQTSGYNTMINSSGIIADYIYTGQLDAGQVNVVNIDAGNITAGTLDFQDIGKTGLNVIASELSISQISDIDDNLGTINAGTVNGVFINGAVITGSLIRTSSSGDRVEMDDNSARLTVFDGSQEYAKIGPQMYDGPSGNLSSIDTLGIIRTDSNFYGLGIILGGTASIGGDISCSGFGGIHSQYSISTNGSYVIDSKTAFYVSGSNDLTCQASNFSGTFAVDGEVYSNNRFNCENGYQINGKTAINEDANGHIRITPDQFSGGDVIFQMGSKAGTQEVRVQEDFTVNGTKNFAIPYPVEGKEEKELYHSTVEGPTAGENLYRWRVEVGSNLETSIELPDYWSALNGNPQVWVSPFEHFGRAYGKVNDNKTYLRIYADQPGTYEVMAIGTRIDPKAQRSWKGVERPKRHPD